jgi:hypothetical protein
MSLLKNIRSIQRLHIIMGNKKIYGVIELSLVC